MQSFVISSPKNNLEKNLNDKLSALSVSTIISVTQTTSAMTEKKNTTSGPKDFTTDIVTLVVFYS